MKRLILISMMLLMIAAVDAERFNICFAADYTQDPNCQGAWLMDEDEGNLTDSSQNSNTAALMGAGEPSFATADPPASYSTGYYVFDGSDDYCEAIDDPSLTPAGEFSITAWIYVTSFGDNNYGRICDKFSSPGGYSFYVNNNPAGYPAGRKTLSANIRNGGGTSGSGDDNIIDTGAWYHVACVFDDAADTVTFYVDGADSGGFATTESPAPNTIDFTIGDRSDLSRSFDGRIDELAFFDRVLSQAEIQDIMANGLNGERAPDTNISHTMRFQAKLTDKAGVMVANGEYELRFRLYDAESGGNMRWEETRDGENEVDIVNGLLDVELGSVTELDITFDKQYWLGIKVREDSEMTPRFKLTTVPYAFISEE